MSFASNSTKNLLRLAALLLVVFCAMGTSVTQAAAPAAIPINGKTEKPAQVVAPGWHVIMGKAVLLHARHSMPNTAITMREGAVKAGGWNSDGKTSAVRVIFERKGQGAAKVEYLISPWQRLSWKGLEAHAPKIVTVNKHAIVLGPIVSNPDDASKKLAALSLVIMEDLAGKSFCDKGTADGIDHNTSTSAVHPALVAPRVIHRFKPYHVVVDYPWTFLSEAQRNRAALPANFKSPPWQLPKQDEASWSHVVSDRMLLLIMRKRDPKAPGGMIRFEFIKAAKVDRSRPQRFDRGEQRLAPGTDLAGASRKLDQQIRAITSDALDHAFRFDNKLVAKERKQIVKDRLNALKKAIFAHPAHSGPAHAAGAGAYEGAARQLEALLVDEVFPAFDEGHWSNSLIAYAPNLVDDLAKLPPAQMDRLGDLADAFTKYAKQAKAKPGMHPARVGSYSPSDDELMLAEVGDRIRAVVKRGPRKEASKILAGKMPRATELKYQGYRLWANHPDKVHPKSAYTGVEITVPFSGRSSGFNQAGLFGFGVPVEAKEVKLANKVNKGNMNSAKYFKSPKEAVKGIRQMLRDKNWHALAVHYDISGDAGVKVNPADLLSGKFFYRKQEPIQADAMGLWRYKHPFHPAFEFSHIKKTAKDDVIKVYVKIEIDQGSGPVQVGYQSFLLSKTSDGYQVIPTAELIRPLRA
jgi:hypothetical protein